MDCTAGYNQIHMAPETKMLQHSELRKGSSATKSCLLA
ncbi:unnamed protein product [Rhodiola kirilowii]